MAPTRTIYMYVVFGLLLGITVALEELDMFKEYDPDEEYAVVDLLDYILADFKRATSANQIDDQFEEDGTLGLLATNKFGVGDPHPMYTEYLMNGPDKRAKIRGRSIDRYSRYYRKYCDCAIFIHLKSLFPKEANSNGYLLSYLTSSGSWNGLICVFSSFRCKLAR